MACRLLSKYRMMEKDTFYAGRIILEFIEYALVFTVIAECNTLFHNSENYIPTSAEVVLTLISIVLAAFLVLVYGLRTGKAFIEDLKNNRFVWCTVLACVVLFFVVNVVRIGGTHAVRKYFFSFVLFLPLSYCLFRLYRLVGKPNELFYKHSDIICFIAILNLMVYLCVTLNPYVVQVQLTQTHWGGLSQLNTWNNYLNVCVVTPQFRILMGLRIFRNYGFTTEPLMYSIPLITALYTEMFLRPQQRKVWRMILLFAAIATTQSVLGLLIAVGTIGIKLFAVCMGTRRKWLVIPIAIIVLGIALVLIYHKRKTGSASFTIHLEHYRASLDAFFHHPLFGVGYVNTPAVVAFVKDSISASDQGLSNSVTAVLAEGGVLLGGICMAPFFILFCQSRKQSNMKNVALWTVGPFGLYCLTIIHFRLLLLLFMAVGYSMLEMKTPEGHKRRIALVDDTEVSKTQETEMQSDRMTRFVQIGMIALVAATQVLLLFSARFWKAVFTFLKTNQLFFGQSAWKLYCFSLFLLLLIIIIKFWIGIIEKKKQPALTKEAVFYAAYTILFLFLYPSIYSWVSTAFGSIHFLGDVIETLTIALIYFVGIFAVWILIFLFSFDKKLASAGLACLAFCGVLFSGLAMELIMDVELDTDGIDRCLAEAEKSAKGKLYANEFPAAWKTGIPDIKYCGARCGAFAVMEDASVIAKHNDVLSELLESGFEVTELSDEYILYSNDKALIATLSDNGYPFYMYYPYERSTEDESTKKLTSGTYTLTADLRLLSTDPDRDQPLCRIDVTYNDGRSVALSQEIRADQFDEKGDASAEIPFSAGDWDKIEYICATENENAVQLVSMTIRQTPSEIVLKEYDGRHMAILESYYDIEGNPQPKEENYYATTKKYNRAGRVVEEGYLGKQGKPVSISRGYASVRYEYNSRGQVTKEQFFDEEGHACVIIDGFASVEQEYNNKWQLVRSSYYSDDGQLCMLPQGYAYSTIEYDNVGNVSWVRFYDPSGHLAMTTSGYAVLYREYNDRKSVVYEAYYGTEAEPVALSNGVASFQIEYHADGTERSRILYDLNGEVIHSEG